MKLSDIGQTIVFDASEAFANMCYREGFGCLQSVKSHKVLPTWPGHDTSAEVFRTLDHANAVANAIIERCIRVEEGKLL